MSGKRMTVRFDLLGPLARSGAATDGLTHSIKQALELLWKVCNYCDQRFETPEVLCMLLATLLKTAPSLGTNQGLGRPLTLGLMRHVHLVRLNCLVKMLTAILPNANR